MDLCQQLIPIFAADRSFLAAGSVVEEEDTTKTARQSSRAFLLEDNETNVFVMQSFLEISGFPQATVATDLAQAEAHLPALARGEFDLVIFDLRLPDGESRELARKVKQSTEVPLLAYTANWSARDNPALLAVGFDAILTKPLEYNHFSSLIDRYFS